MARNLAMSVIVLILGCGLAVAQATPQMERITNGPVVESVAGTSAVIAWSTDTGGSSVVHYGTSPQSLSQVAEAPYATGQNTHRVSLKGLQPNTTYYFQVISGQGQGTGTQALSGVGQFTTAENGGDKVPLYRAYKTGGGHVFTTSYQEWQQAAQSGGKDEGIAAYIMKSQAPGTEPLYRSYDPSTGDNFYTSNAGENQHALQTGYQDKGIAGYVASSQTAGTVPLYRLYNAQTREHFYTTNDAEKNDASQKGFRVEGIAGYVWPH